MITKSKPRIVRCSCLSVQQALLGYLRHIQNNLCEVTLALASLVHFGIWPGQLDWALGWMIYVKYPGRRNSLQLEKDLATCIFIRCPLENKSPCEVLATYQILHGVSMSVRPHANLSFYVRAVRSCPSGMFSEVLIIMLAGPHS